MYNVYAYSYIYLTSNNEVLTYSIREPTFYESRVKCEVKKRKLEPR